MSCRCSPASGHVEAIIASSLKTCFAADKPTFLAVLFHFFLIPQVPPCPEHFSTLTVLSVRYKL